jgi:hypothetical protein
VGEQPNAASAVTSTAAQVTASTRIPPAPVVTVGNVPPQALADAQRGTTFDDRVHALIDAQPGNSTAAAAQTTVGVDVVPTAVLGPPAKSSVFLQQGPDQKSFVNANLYWASSPALSAVMVEITSQFQNGDHPEIGHPDLQRQFFNDYAEQTSKPDPNAAWSVINYSARTVDLPVSKTPALVVRTTTTEGVRFFAAAIQVTVEVPLTADEPSLFTLCDALYAFYSKAA